MRSSFFTALAAALCAIVLLHLPACINSAPTGHSKRPAPTAPTGDESGALVTGHKAKDKAVVGAADDIDEEVEGTPQAPAVKAKTDEIRGAVAAAPAEQIAEILARFDKALGGWEALVRDRDEKIAAQQKRIAALEDAELRAQVRTIRWVGAALIVAGVLVGYLAREIPFALALGAAGFLALGVAQLWAYLGSQPWFLPAVGGVVILGLAGFGWAAWHAYKKGDLAKKTAREAMRLKETLAVMVPAIDEAKQALDGAAQDTLLSTLSRLMDSDHKKVVKEIRAAV